MSRVRKLTSLFIVSVLLFSLPLALKASPARAQNATPTPSPLDALPRLLITATDFHFDMPDSIAAGQVAVTLQNNGSEPHHAAFLKLNNGVTFDQVQTALAKGPEAIFGLTTFAGGPGTIIPGAHQRVALDLTAGQYVVVCFITSPDGTSHAAKGMVRQLSVTAGTPQASSAPSPDLTVTMLDFAFELPSSVHSGLQIWNVVNDGPQPHELSLFKLTSIPPDQLQAALEAIEAPSSSTPPAGPPPIVPVGGVEPLATGASALVELNLEAGTYAAVCFVPDQASGKPHFELGMVQTFTVAS